MKTAIAIISLVLLTGCAEIKSMVPSFWDDNQSSKITDIRMDIAILDCAKPHLPQVEKIYKDIQWFQMYSESKGWRQQDVIKLTQPLAETVADFVKRSQTTQGSEKYCELKKQVMQAQAKRAAQAVLGRF